MNTGAWIASMWVRLYSSGMPFEMGLARRAEIDADLWDHQKDAAERGVPPVVSGSEILLRTVLGIPDDLCWRFESIRAARSASLDRRMTTMTLSAKHIRWMGLGGLIGGLIWAVRYFVPVEPATVFRSYGHIVLAVLFLVGLLGFYAQQRGRTGRAGRVGYILLLIAFLSWLAINVLGTVFGVNDKSLLMNILGVSFVFLLPPGFLLLGSGMNGPARRAPLAIGCVFLAWLLFPRAVLIHYFPSTASFLRQGGDSPLGVAVFFLLGVALAVMGHSVFRNAAAAPDIQR